MCGRLRAERDYQLRQRRNFSRVIEGLRLSHRRAAKGQTSSSPSATEASVASSGASAFQRLDRGTARRPAKESVAGSVCGVPSSLSPGDDWVGLARPLKDRDVWRTNSRGISARKASSRRPPCQAMTMGLNNESLHSGASKGAGGAGTGSEREWRPGRLRDVRSGYSSAGSLPRAARLRGGSVSFGRSTRFGASRHGRALGGAPPPSIGLPRCGNAKETDMTSMNKKPEINP